MDRNSTTNFGERNIRYVSSAIDPRLKLLLVAVRRALIILADALQDYYES